MERELIRSLHHRRAKTASRLSRFTISQHEFDAPIRTFEPEEDHEEKAKVAPTQARSRDHIIGTRWPAKAITVFMDI